MIKRSSLTIAALLGGCTVGPNYAPPKAGVPPVFAESASAQATGDVAEWWKGFRDPELDRLVALALTGNLDLKAAVARIARARAEVRTAGAEALPEVGGSADATHIHFSKNAGLSSLSRIFGGGAGGGTSGGPTPGGIAAPGSGVTTYSLGFDASWEIDLFGGTRRTVEAAGAREEAAEWSARDVGVSLAAEVADDYLRMRLAQQREGIARAEIARQQRALKIMGETAQVGLVPQGDYVRQRTQLATAQAALPTLVGEQRAAMHAVAILLARPPGDFVAELSAAQTVVAQRPVVSPGIPSDLLRRRPDIRAAERNLAAATADIGVAVADLYPRFSLTGMAELISTALGNLFTTDSIQATASAALNFPVLDFGRRRARIDERRAAADEAYLTYQKTVLSALRDVEDALARLTAEQQRNAALRSGVADAERSEATVRARYTTGLIGLTAVLEAQAAVLLDHDLLAQSDGQLSRDTVALYKALGGGWDSATSH